MTMSKWYTFEEALCILGERNMDDEDFVSLTKRLCSFDEPVTNTKRDLFLRASAEMLESKYIISFFFEMYTNKNTLLKHGVRMATDIISFISLFHGDNHNLNLYLYTCNIFSFKQILIKKRCP